MRTGCLDLKSTLKRLFPLFLAILVLLTAVEQPSCACDNTKPSSQGSVRVPPRSHVAASSVMMREHSCCHMTPTAKFALEATDCVHQSKPCCGMVDKSSPAIANSIRITANPEPRIVKLSFFSHVDLLHCITCQLPIARINRAPPYLKGLGSSETYLFKRSLLL